MVQTWDFETKCEISMFQTKFDSKCHPEHHFIRGLNQKRNYFAGNYHIYDLENNIPWQRFSNPISEICCNR